MSLSMGTRVFVRLYDGYTQQESEEELVTLPPPLTWNAALAIMIMAVNKQETEPEPAEIQQARLFLLPSDPNGVVAELNARALRMGVRDNDQFAICLHGEEYRRPGDAKVDRFEMSAPSLPPTSSLPPLVPPPASTSNDTNSSMHAFAPPSGTMNAAPPSGMFSNDGEFRKRTKRFRSISGKMAAIKSLGDKGIISAEDRGTLKDLLLNNDSQALQDALDRYQSTGEFQQVKDLLERELRAPSAKRATGDWLPDGFIQDMSLTFRPSDPQSPVENSSAQYATLLTNSVTGESNSSYQTSYSTEINPTPYVSRQTDPNELTWSNSSTHMNGSNANGMYGAQMEHTISAQAMAPTYNTTSVQGPEAQPIMYRHSTQPDPHAYAVNATGYPQAQMYQQHPNQRASFGLPEYPPNSMNGYAPSPMGYAAPIQTYAGYQYVTPAQAFGYGAMPGQGYYTAFSYGGKDMDDGKWSAQSPMPSYPPACSKEEKKEKIARWLKKREHRNWSNKPSYPVRHAIATKRERGEDGRFVTKPKVNKSKKAGDASNITSDEPQEEVRPMPSALLSM